MAVGVGVGDDDDAWSDEEFAGGGVSVERGSDSDGATDGCELSLLLSVIAILKAKKRGPGCPHRNEPHLSL